MVASKLRRRAAYLVYWLVARRLPMSGAPGGKLGRRVRTWTCRRLLRECGQDVNIEAGADFGWGANVSVGDRSGLGVDCWIRADLTLGRDVMMGPRVMIFGRDHLVDDATRPMTQQGMGAFVPVVVEDNVWIGGGTTILKGIRIGSGSIIGAGSVVTRDVPPGAIVAGNPARVIKPRTAA